MHCDLDLYFQDHTISINHILYNIWKSLELAKKISSRTFIEVGSSHRMKPWRMLYIVTLTYIFYVKISGNHITWIVRKTARASEQCSMTSFIHADIGHRMAPLWMLHLCLYFQGHTISGNHIIYNIWKTLRASAKCSNTSFIEIDISHRMASSRMLYIMTLTYLFKVTQFLEIIIYNIRKRWEPTKNIEVVFHRGWYSLSNGVSLVFLSRGFDKKFKVKRLKYECLAKR